MLMIIRPPRQTIVFVHDRIDNSFADYKSSRVGVVVVGAVY